MARSSGARRVLLIGALLVSGLLLSGCSADDVPRFGWPAGVTDKAKHMQHFWSWTVIAALIIGVLVWGLMFWTFTFHRKRKNSPTYPKQTKENTPLELVYTAVPLFLVAVLFYFAVTTENYVTDKVADPNVRIDVTAFKWGWDFGYTGTKDPVTGQEIHTVETPSEVPILMLPENQVIQYTLMSKDVVHSFWVPDFLFKRDVFPDPAANNTDNVFQNTIEQTGAFVGRCAELCGTYHSAMNFEVRSVPENVYTDYLKYRQAINPATGHPWTSSDALTQTGKDISSCGNLCSPKSITTYPIAPNRAAKAASQPGDS